MQIQHTNPFALGPNVVLPPCFLPAPLSTEELEIVLVEQGPERAVVVDSTGAVLGLFEWDPPCDLLPTDDFIEAAHEYAAAE